MSPFFLEAFYPKKILGLKEFRLKKIFFISIFAQMNVHFLLYLHK
jgi:hypothetical protein